MTFRSVLVASALTLAAPLAALLSGVFLAAPLKVALDLKPDASNPLSDVLTATIAVNAALLPFVVMYLVFKLQDVFGRIEGSLLQFRQGRDGLQKWTLDDERKAGANLSDMLERKDALVRPLRWPALSQGIVLAGLLTGLVFKSAIVHSPLAHAGWVVAATVGTVVGTALVLTIAFRSAIEQ